MPALIDKTNTGSSVYADTAYRSKKNETWLAVHGDVQALLTAGVLDRTDSGRVVFPYDAVHVDFTLHKAP